MFSRSLRRAKAWRTRQYSGPSSGGTWAVTATWRVYGDSHDATPVAGAAAVFCAAALWLQHNSGNSAVCEQKASVPFDAILRDIDEIFRREKEAAHIPGMAYGVMKDGKLVHSVALGLADVEKMLPVDLSTRFRIASMSKSFVALAIMQLRDRGHLRLEDPVSNYIPDLKLIPVGDNTEDCPALTIRHLLIHAGGLPQEDPWGDRKLDMSTEDFMDLISGGVSHSSVPGTAFEYSNLGYTLLGKIIEVVSGEPYQRYVKSNIFDPLGMNDTTYEIDDVPTGKLAVGYRWEQRKWSREEMLHDGTFGAMGGIVTTIEDYSKYIAMHMSAWPAGGPAGDGPVRRNTLREMHTAVIMDAVLVDPIGFSANPTPTYFANCYGLGFRVSKYPDGTIVVGHAGGLPGFGCDFRFLPTHPGFSILSFTNRTYGEMPKVNLMAIKRVLADVERDPVPVSSTLQKRSMQLKAILAETCVVPPRKYRLCFDYESIWNKKPRNCFADNFLVDIPSRIRALEFHKLLVDLGGYISHFSPIIATNYLRGKFLVTGINGRQIEIAFTLSPEKEPKIQHMTTKLLPIAPAE